MGATDMKAMGVGPNPIRKFLRGALIGTTVLSLSACVSDGFLAEESGDEIVKISYEKIKNEDMRAGLEELQQAEYDAAAKHFNRALKLNPQDSYAHLFNAIAYHLKAEKGDRSRFVMAEIGYKQALKFDRANWLAAYQLGLLYMEMKRYKDAQNQLSYALMFSPRDEKMLAALAAASYYAQDVETSAATISKVLETQPKNQAALRTAAMVWGAAGDDEKARKYLKLYEEQSGNQIGATRLSLRLGDWRDFHKRKGYLQKAQFASSMDSGGGGSDEPPAAVGNGPGGKPLSAKDMVILDVVIIRTEERLTTSKGVNLLSGLTLNFSVSDLTVNTIDPNNAITNTVAEGNKVKTYRRNVYLGSSTTDATAAISYSLNIANSADDRNEILARPSLVATHGKTSEFFSGGTLSMALTGTEGGDLVDKDVGVSLAVTPQFVDRDNIFLGVKAARSFFDTVASSGLSLASTSSSFQTSKINVSANVVMRFGETLILSGLSEKETQEVNTGVPFLKEIPGIQYLFSNETTLDFQKSVLILVTPRNPEYVYREGTGNGQGGPGGGSDGQRHLEELKSRHTDWFKPYPNLASVFHHMQANPLYREFRTGDVALETWHSTKDLSNRINRALDFLHF